MNLREYANQQQHAAADSKPTAPAHPQQLPDNYRRAYREVFNFHARHTPAPQTLEQWQAAAADLTKTAAAMDNTPFVNALLNAVYEELERQQEPANIISSSTNIE